jgi:hypothetical protein
MQQIKQTGSSINTSHLHSGCARMPTLMTDGLSGLPHPNQEIATLYLKLDHNSFIQNTFPFIMQYHPIIWYYKVRPTDSARNYKQNNKSTQTTSDSILWSWPYTHSQHEHEHCSTAESHPSDLNGTKRRSDQWKNLDGMNKGQWRGETNCKI